MYQIGQYQLLINSIEPFQDELFALHAKYTLGELDLQSFMQLCTTIGVKAGYTNELLAAYDLCKMSYAILNCAHFGLEKGLSSILQLPEFNLNQQLRSWTINILSTNHYHSAILSLMNVLNLNDFEKRQILYDAIKANDSALIEAVQSHNGGISRMQNLSASLYALLSGRFNIALNLMRHSVWTTEPVLISKVSEQAQVLSNYLKHDSDRDYGHNVLQFKQALSNPIPLFARAFMNRLDANETPVPNVVARKFKVD